MNIGLLIIGNELLEGKIQDANTQTLSLFLREHHRELTTSLVVRDTTSEIHRGLASLFSVCDIVLTSGGLGPTKDDITKEAIASYLNRKIEFSEESHQVALQSYHRYKREFPGLEHGYCYLPQGFMALTNSTGFAPGLFTQHEGKLLFCGPGVPREFKSLLQDHFLTLTQRQFPALKRIESVTVRTKKIPEEKIFGEVDKTLWGKLEAHGDVSSLPTIMGVDIGVKLTADSEEELQEKKEKVLEIFKSSPVSKNIWQFGRLTLEEVIVQTATEKQVTFGFAESCTGGLCSHRITSVPGSSRCFWGSVVSYDESVKEQLLNVNPLTIKNHGVVSAECAQEMAHGLKQNLRVDLAISITGIAGPSGGTPERPVGSVSIGVATAEKSWGEDALFFGDREQLKNRFAQGALFTLLEELEKIS